MLNEVQDSASVGDASRFVPLEVLQRTLADAKTASTDAGTVVLIVRRGEGGRRETPERVGLTPAEGIPGDAWGRKANPNPATQLTVMQADVAGRIANGQPWTLFGDNLFVDLDLSSRNLPPGSRLRAGQAVLEVSPIPHTGCRKFVARFGKDALEFVSMASLRERNLRGVHMRVVEAGAVGRGDPVFVIQRAGRE